MHTSVGDVGLTGGGANWNARSNVCGGHMHVYVSVYQCECVQCKVCVKVYWCMCVCLCVSVCVCMCLCVTYSIVCVQVITHFKAWQVSFPE